MAKKSTKTKSHSRDMSDSERERISKLEPSIIHPSQFGSRLKSIRERLGLTQKQLGEKLGVSDHLICKLEKSERYPTARVYYRLSRFLNMEQEKFLSPDFSVSDIDIFKNAKEKKEIEENIIIHMDKKIQQIERRIDSRITNVLKEMEGRIIHEIAQKRESEEDFEKRILNKIKAIHHVDNEINRKNTREKVTH